MICGFNLDLVLYLCEIKCCEIFPFYIYTVKVEIKFRNLVSEKVGLRQPQICSHLLERPKETFKSVTCLFSLQVKFPLTFPLNVETDTNLSEVRFINDIKTGFICDYLFCCCCFCFIFVFAIFTNL